MSFLTEQLIRATIKGNIEIVKAKIAENADINALGNGQMNPLMWAAAEKHLEIVKILSRKSCRCQY